MDWEKGCYNGNYFDLVEEKKIDIFVNVNFAIMSSPNGNKKKKKRINIIDKNRGGIYSHLLLLILIFFK